jgi:GNAT superfamily N-acetyltransferase
VESDPGTAAAYDSLVIEGQANNIEITLLRDEHLKDAAALVASRYRAEREHEPSLPSRYEDARSALQPLRNLAGRAPGVAAIRGGRLAGFLLGQALPMFKGKRSVYSPEWAHAAEAEECRRIYQAMYARLSSSWLANGCFTHLITLLAHDQEAIDAWFWMGFGLTAVDAVRDLSPVEKSTIRVDIRRAGLEDVDRVMALTNGLQQHLAAAPIFLVFVEQEGRPYHEGWLANSANALFLATRHDEAVAYMRLEPSNPSAAHVIRDEKTVRISGAFTEAGARNSGIGTALLAHSLGWALSVGYERCAVDFEPQNIPGARFWLRYFEPVCYSLIRHVDERIAWAHEERDDKDFW